MADVAAPRSPTWAATSCAYTPAALLMARAAPSATRTRRQTRALVRYRRASHPGGNSLAPSIATVIPTTDSGAPPVPLDGLKSPPGELVHAFSGLGVCPPCSPPGV